MIKFFLSGPLIITVFFAEVSAAVLDLEKDIHIDAEPLHRESPNYPMSRARRYQEGLVDVGMMVGKDGAVYSPIVNLSTHVDFEEFALKAVMKYKFKPATFNGVAVDSYYDIRIKFSMEGAKNNVSERFASLLESAKKELAKDQPSQKKLDRRIESMSKVYYMTHYSLSHLATVKAQVAARFGDEQSQLDTLNQLLIFEDAIGEKGKILEGEVLEWVKLAVIKAQLRLGRLRAAYLGYSELQESAPSSAMKFDAIMTEVKDVLASGKPFSQTLNLGGRAYQEVPLVATKFDIRDVVGGIEKLTFRCERGYSEIVYQANSEYQVPPTWGSCKVQISGSENATAALIQYQ
jgi:TonB family protein